MTNQTSIITGASEGLGKSFAIELASRRINLVLVSLPATGLPELASFIRKNFEVKVNYLEIDLTLAESYPAIFNYLSDEQITAHLLINNAGLGNWSWFEDLNIGFYKKQIELNVITPVLLTRLFLAQADVSATSYILNVGSLGGLFVVPKKQVYGATKSFIRYFTKCLQQELHGSNVKISLLSPGGINTKPELLVMNNKLRGISKATIMEPGYVARIAVDGLLRGKKEIIPGMINRMLVLLNSLLPAGVKEIIIRQRLATIIKS
ncbi:MULTISPECIES: SDR family NAD(P)-dependent oxidoreductase [Mucilaginibacter]|nr:MULTISPECIES: SDR family NAD(P)-dependent oxidoreductase [Mucilaginibacter]QTE43463.1 SDR family NAD(P)-dependent oxidoreductase [Mucilaginibacter rubeus]QTE50063.1 SDR family NAD(P)-dependent oxidoreductase [Mucilaginibacter rubeus]QTE55152.1 SDR family NAD(P)-dependent oxidoreductase [Mucilaginibacter rubeus]QTE65389.1 SDR family NAD(P)-dependent oxidoreductase [Mucilaginibacter rubeus]QTF64142.1 SDR family NAD(P)-dependent oxidoreductase [Mucilaginibacter rubeus]